MKKILLTGGGTGGHIYPLISVGKRLKEIGKGDIEIKYIGPKSNWGQEIKDMNIEVFTITGAKFRRYFDIKNLIDIPKFIYSIFEALFKLYFTMPDIVFSKGGPGSIAVVLAAKFYMIPVVIHESDAIPSLTSKITGKLAKKIGLSFESTKKYFPQSKTFVSGNPIRDEFLAGSSMNKTQAKNYLGFNDSEPLILVMGGSQGSERINTAILDNLNYLTNDFQIYHLVGEDNLMSIKNTTDMMLKNWNQDKRNRYKYKGYISAKEMFIAMNASDLIISRSGAGTIFEAAYMGLPAILVPLKESANGHQKANAYEYSRAGGAIVIEENNLTANIISSRAKNILQSPQNLKQMSQAAKNFAKPDAPNTIAKEIFNLIL